VASALASLCARGARAYAFHPGTDFAAEIRGVRVPALAPLLEGLRLAADEPSYASALSALEAEVPVRSAAFGALVRELAPSGKDQDALASLGAGLPVEALLTLPGRPASLLWFLVRAGALELRPAEAAHPPRLSGPR
jgi:hypothetical protein